MQPKLGRPHQRRLGVLLTATLLVVACGTTPAPTPTSGGPVSNLTPTPASDTSICAQLLQLADARPKYNECNDINVEFAAIKALEAQLMAKDSELDTTERIIEQRQAALKARQIQLDESTVSLAKAKSDLDTRYKTLKTQEEELRKLNNNINTTDGRIAAIDRQYRATGAPPKVIEEYRLLTASRDALAKQYNDRYSVYQRDDKLYKESAAEYNKKKQAHDASIQAHNAQLNEHKKQFTDYDAKIHARNSGVADLNARMDRHNTKVGQFNQWLEARRINLKKMPDVKSRFRIRR